MKIRKDYTCPLEIVHDIVRGKWKPIIFISAERLFKILVTATKGD